MLMVVEEAGIGRMQLDGGLGMIGRSLQVREGKVSFRYIPAMLDGQERWEEAQGAIPGSAIGYAIDIQGV